MKNQHKSALKRQISAFTHFHVGQTLSHNSPIQRAPEVSPIRPSTSASLLPTQNGVDPTPRLNLLVATDLARTLPYLALLCQLLLCLPVMTKDDQLLDQRCLCSLVKRLGLNSIGKGRVSDEERISLRLRNDRSVHSIAYRIADHNNLFLLT
jgi:hypothetical protein